MKISQNGIEALKDYEGCKLTAYKDGGGVWTIGVGSTKNVTPNLVITMAEAEERLKWDLAEAERDVNQFVKVPLTQNEYDALVSFTFNLGGPAINKSTLLRLLNKGTNRTLVGDQFLRWCKDVNPKTGKLEVVPGLLRRREKERKMFLSSN